jgi:poly-gamma-glutamate capsule biosynthesis protein CapA/YwtB (metallophosphatase superfamily)
LADNHVLDWGYDGLIDTLEALRKVNIKSTGAGRTFTEAKTPAAKSVPGKGRVLVFAFGLASSGIPQTWSAGRQSPGVYLLRDLSHQSLLEVQQMVANHKRRGDIVVASIHWGSNWGYRIPPKQISFAHQLIEAGGVDIVHGHSSHHIKAIEVYNAKLILYGCGDFINDYEGIGGYEEFRPDLSLMYFATLDSTIGKLLDLQMTPTQIKRFQIKRASRGDARWLKTTLTREGSVFGTRVEMTGGDSLKLRWD